MIFVVTVRIMKIVDGRKEIFMKEKIVKRMEHELNEYREYLVSGKLTAQKILEEAYQLVIKQELYYIFENHNCSRLSEEEWNWMNQQDNILDYLYDLWMNILTKVWRPSIPTRTGFNFYLSKLNFTTTHLEMQS